MVGSLFLIKLQGFRCFIVNITKSLRAAFFVEYLRWLLLQMFCFTLYFQKGIAECIVAIHCKIILFRNLKSISFAFIQCATPCHSLYYSLPSVDTRCHSLSFIVTRCHSLYHLLSRCHSLYHSLSFVATRCHSLSLVVRLVVTRCHSVYHWSVFF